jgi:hypothetical protein
MVVQRHEGTSMRAPHSPRKVFISHASEDKDGFVRSLAQVLNSVGIDVWYDEYSLKAGDSEVISAK